MIYAVAFGFFKNQRVFMFIYFLCGDYMCLCSCFYFL